jgi:hypothetical protein
MIRDPEMDVDRGVRRRVAGQKVTTRGRAEKLAPRWLAPSMERAQRSLDREHQHFIEPWE